MFDIQNAPDAIKADAEAQTGFSLAFRNEAQSDAAELYILEQMGEDFRLSGDITFLRASPNRLHIFAGL